VKNNRWTVSSDENRGPIEIMSEKMRGGITMKSHRSVSLIFGILIVSVVITLASTAGIAMAADKEEA
jgi:hypothetical protein